MSHDYLIWKCSACERQMQSREWPDTTKPLCGPCFRRKELRAARGSIGVALRADDFESPTFLPALARLVYELTARNGEREWDTLPSWPLEGEGETTEDWLPADREDIPGWDDGIELRSSTPRRVHAFIPLGKELLEMDDAFPTSRHEPVGPTEWPEQTSSAGVA